MAAGDTTEEVLADLAALLEGGGAGSSRERDTFVLEGNFSGLQLTPRFPNDCWLTSYWSNGAGVIISRAGRQTLPATSWVGLGEGLIGVTTSASVWIQCRTFIKAGDQIYVYFPSAVNVMLQFEVDHVEHIGQT